MAKTIPMTMDQVRNVAPSVFAQGAHSSRSSRYAYIPTVSILEALSSEGFQVFDARQSRSSLGNREHTKHMLRFRHPSLAPSKVGDVFPEAILINSHNGASSYDLSAGLYRLWCDNGAATSMGEFTSLHVKHVGNVRDKVIEGTYTVIEQAAKAVKVADDWRGLVLSEQERMALAQAAHMLRFGNSEGEIEPGSLGEAISPDRLLHIRRVQDKEKDLWTTFNVIQENVLRGGLRGISVNPETNRARRTRTKPVTSIDHDMRLNKALWVLATKLAETREGSLSLPG